MYNSIVYKDVMHTEHFSPQFSSVQSFSCVRLFATPWTAAHQDSQRIFRTDFLQDGLVGSPCTPRGSQHPSFFPQGKTISL